MIWDTAGQERFHALGPIYYRDANGALLVYDITDRESFNKVRNWVKELRKIVGKNITLVIAGNKVDLEKNRQVDAEEAKEYAKSVGAEHLLCSAKTGKGVEETFLQVVKGMIKMEQKKKAPSSDSQHKHKHRTFVPVVGEEEATEDKGGCC